VSVGRHDNFFALGGHSLLAVRLIEAAPRGPERRRGTLFANPTLAALAATIGHTPSVEVPANRITADLTQLTRSRCRWRRSPRRRSIASSPACRGTGQCAGLYALSPLQEGILFHHLMSEQGDPHFADRTAGVPDRHLLDRYLAAVQRVVDRHDIPQQLSLGRTVRARSSCSATPRCRSPRRASIRRRPGVSTLARTMTARAAHGSTPAAAAALPCRAGSCRWSLASAAAPASPDR
jgi:hypothetical protein